MMKWIPTRKMLSIAVALLVTLMGTVALAQGDAFEFNYHQVVEAKKGKPTITLTANEDVVKGSLKITRNDGKVIRTSLKKMSAGDTKVIDLKQPKGHYTYKLEIHANLGEDQVVENVVNFDIFYQDPITLEGKPTDLSLDENRLKMKTNRSLKTAELEFFDVDGRSTGTHIIDISRQGKNLVLEWPQRPEEIGKVEVKVYDAAGYWTRATVTPFWIEIPHQEVDFETGKSTWTKDEEYKLVETLNEIKRQMSQYGKLGLEMQLYIAGYTDTVGTAESNLALSRARASAIASWFVKHKLPIPVYIQGFGESVLAVGTPDETPEAANRRVLYLLGTTRPAPSPTMPKSNWARVK